DADRAELDRSIGRDRRVDRLWLLKLDQVDPRQDGEPVDAQRIALGPGIDDARGPGLVRKRLEISERQAARDLLEEERRREVGIRRYAIVRDAHLGLDLRRNEPVAEDVRQGAFRRNGQKRDRRKGEDDRLTEQVAGHSEGQLARRSESMMGVEAPARKSRHEREAESTLDRSRRLLVLRAGRSRAPTLSALTEISRPRMKRTQGPGDFAGERGPPARIERRVGS